MPVVLCLLWLLPSGTAWAAPALPATPVATGLSFPTNMALAPDGRIFFTEKDTGRIRVIQGGRLLPKPFAKLEVVPAGETGALGIALDPGFPARPWVYVYFTDRATGRNRLIRIHADGNTGGEQQLLIDLLPQTGYHNGGDLAFGTDGKLYVTVGEAHQMNRAQDVDDVGGKVLRLNPDGSVPPDDPFGADNPAFSMGLRNSFGICVDPRNGTLWETENGPDRFDEVNRIRAGANYGWPIQLGPGGTPRFVDPVLSYRRVIVPTGCAFSGGSLYFGDFQGELHRVMLEPPAFTVAASDRVVAILPSGITDVETQPDGSLLVSTVDSIVRIRAQTLAGAEPIPHATTASAQPIGRGSGSAIFISAAIAALTAALLLVVRMRRRRP